VVNIITRNSYDGLEIGMEASGAADYDKFNASLLWGSNWDHGNAMIAIQHSYASDIPNATRQRDHNFIPYGGTNQDTFVCPGGTFQPNATGSTYYVGLSGATIQNAQTNAPCNVASGDYLPKETRDNAMAKFSQNITPDFTLNGTMIYSIRKGVSYTESATVNGVTAYGAGAQANPFYQNPVGVTATKQAVRVDLTGLLPNSISPQGDNDIYGNLNAQWRINDGLELTAFYVIGQDDSYSDTYGGICSACANLALNGTTQSGGSTTTASVIGTTLTALNLPLTTANALDVWDPVATNKTSPATIAAIASNNATTTAIDAFEQARIGADGNVFALPAGEVKFALGGELYVNSLVQKVTKSNSTGIAAYGSGFSVYHFGRVVESGYGEVAIPLISPDMNIPLMKKVDLDISARYDHYSDVGPTSNPKFALSWEVADGFKIRGNYSTSFVAPQLDSVGDPSQNYRAAYGGLGGSSTVVNFPTALYPGTAGVLPGCAATAVTCSVGGTLQGISVQRGIGANAKPQVGSGYSVGFDFAPDFLPGLISSVTLFDAQFRGGVTSANASTNANVGALTQYFPIFPNGVAPNSPVLAQYENPYPTLNSALPTTVYFVANQDQHNVENLTAKGLDISVGYDFDTDFGHFKANETATEFLLYHISFGYPTAGPSYSILNTDGITSQFPEIQLQSRTDLGWSGLDGFAADLFINHTGGYRNWTGISGTPLTFDANGNPNGGGDIVKAYTTLDAHISYTFPGGMLNGDQIYLNGINIFNERPPFYNAAGQGGVGGNDDFVTNLIGRVMSVGLQAKF
jgi:iron complex outermembrane receptor protein